MGRECYTANCKGNSDWQTKVKVYRLPRNLEERERWLTIIPRDNTPDIKNLVVCEKHWPQNSPKKLDYGKERARDPTSVSTCVKPTQVPTLPLQKKVPPKHWQKK